MDPNSLTNWRLDTQNRPGGIIVLRVVGRNADGKEVVTAPFVERLPSRQVRTADGKVWRLGKRSGGR